MAWERAGQWSLLVVGEAETDVFVTKERAPKLEEVGVDLPKAKSMMLLEVKPLTESENVHASSAQLVNARGEILLWQCRSMISSRPVNTQSGTQTMVMRKKKSMTSIAQLGSV